MARRAVQEGGFYFLLGLSILVTTITLVNSAVCNNGAKFGVNDVEDYEDNNDATHTGTGFIMKQASYEINCCGVLDRWLIEADNPDSGTETVFFQVWRPTASNDVHELVGQFSYGVTSEGQKTAPVTGSDKITVKSGDLWGWYTSGRNVVRYGSGNTPFRSMSMASVSVGNTHDWSSASNVNSRIYGIRLDLDANSLPSFTNLPGSTTVQEFTATGTSLFTLTVDDVDVSDVSTLSVSMTTNTQFSFDPTTLILETATLTSSSSVENLEFKVSDQCGNTATATYTVTITNDPPVIENLPASANLSEDTSLETLLYVVNVTDFGTVTCAMAASVPAAYPFFVRELVASSEYGIYSSSSPGFSYSSQNQYDLVVDCTDTVATVSGNFYVYLLPNAAPVVHNLQNSTVISTALPIGSNVFTVLTTDAEGDNLNYSMTCDPSPCPFTIFASGQIQVSQDLTGYSTVGHDVYITVSDEKNTVGPYTLTVTFSDINDPVTLSNLPLGSSLAVMENTALATTIFTVSYSDLDTSQAHSITMTSSPSAGLTYFAIDATTGVITTSGTVLNYEALGATSVTFTITVSDPVTSDTDTLTIDIIDVNEAPSFSTASYALSADEGLAGASLGTPTFGIVDPDTGDSYSLSMDCGTSAAYFYMDSTSGEVTFQSDYDVDTGSLSSSVTCTVTATDAAGLTATAPLIITIDNINDNTPVFIPSSYSFYVSFYAGSVTTIGSTTASDGDIGTFGTLTFTLNQTSLGEQLFAIDNSGVISLVKAPQDSASVNYSTSVHITAIATDGGGLTSTADVQIVISDTTTTAATTTTIAYKGFFDDASNMAWLVPCMLIIAAILCVLTWVGCTCHGKNGCEEFRRKWKNRRRTHLGSTKAKWNFEPVAPVSARPPPPPIQMQGWRQQMSDV